MVMNADGSTTHTGLDSLIQRLIPEQTAPVVTSPRGPINALGGRGSGAIFRQSAAVTGELREYDGVTALISKIGSACPSRESEPWPNRTVDTDARKGDARSSP